MPVAAMIQRSMQPGISMWLLLSVPFLSVFLAGCRDTTGQAISCSIQDAEPPVPLAFVACALEEEYQSDSIPILVAVHNLDYDGQIARTSLEITSGLSVWVVGPDGEEREPISRWEPASIPEELLPHYQYRLPRGGVMGCIVDLACDGIEYGGLMPQCAPLFSFAQPGVYTIMLESEATFWCAEPCQTDEAGQVNETPVNFPSVKLRIPVGR